MKAIILAAGCGNRLSSVNKGHKLLLDINGKTILSRLLDNLHGCSIEDKDITFVIGWKASLLRRTLPKDSNIVYNLSWKTTNTAASLWKALCCTQGDILIINGDVVAEKYCFDTLLATPGSALLVDKKLCDDEAVKYRLDQGIVVEVSKQIPNHQADGEVLGINKILAADRRVFDMAVCTLAEKAFYDVAFPVVKPGIACILAESCVEIDTPEDLENCRRIFK